MRNLLIITQKVDMNDDVLGFFHEWIRKFSERSNKVAVICLKLGRYDLPSNVKVLSLGKERIGEAVKKSSLAEKLKYLFNFYGYVWRERHNYDAVFVHMNPKYVLLGWPLWKLWRKKISLWYAHGHVPFMLRIADKLIDVSFASTPEGYRLDSKKLKIVGQGIDVDKFKPRAEIERHETFKIVSIGRISFSKDYETLFKAVEILISSAKLQVEIVGSPASLKDEAYLESLKQTIINKKLNDVVRFTGPIANKDIVPVLQSADLFVNMGHTGSLDKAVLEAMSCGLPILTCNEAYVNILGNHGEMLMYPKKDHQALAEKIKSIMTLDHGAKAQLSADLRRIVVEDHNLEGLADKITEILWN